MKKAGNYQIPFIGKSMLEYAGGWHSPGTVIEWRANAPFEATVELAGHYRGRSAARVNVKNIDNGEEYSLGLAGFYDAVKAFGSRRGQIRGRWVFVKQGSNYALAPLTDEAKS